MSTMIRLRVIVFALIAAAAVAASPAAWPQARGEITLSLRTPLLALDPIRFTAATEGFFLINVVEPLVTVSEKGEYQPLLATSWKTESPTAWTFTLRPNVRFHDGTAMDAAAVKFSLERAKNDPRTVNKSRFEWLKEVQVVNPTTVRLVTDGPYAPILAQLSSLAAAIVSPQAVQRLGDTFNRQPVGTGPFVMNRHVPRDRTIVTRFENYWGGAQQIQRATFVVIVEDNTRLATLLSGEVHVSTLVEPAQMRVLQNNPEIQIIRGLGVLSDYLQFNTSKKPLSDRRVRQAIAHGVNYDQILATVLEGVGQRFGPTFGPGVWGFDQAVMKDPYGFDQERARKLLQEAGYGGGVTIGLLISDRPEHRRMGEAVQAQLARLGVRVELQVFDFGTYAEMSRRGDHQMTIIGWSPTVGLGDPDQALSNFRCSNIGVENRMFYCNDRVERLLKQQAQETDPRRRAQMVKDVVQLIHRDVPRVMMRARESLQAARRNVQGYRHHPNKYDLRGVSLR